MRYELTRRFCGMTLKKLFIFFLCRMRSPAVAAVVVVAAEAARVTLSNAQRPEWFQSAIRNVICFLEATRCVDGVNAFV